ncbi:hypothetical protein K5R88_01790 [Pseudomonas sp. MM213]|jgi:hypothetical protein|nr:MULTISPECIES: hypothetical protein [unclassified Pseudomonas]UCP10405.1 hypothetical protein K5R88_01790 [Pseudomonas sp. MM213]
MSVSVSFILGRGALAGELNVVNFADAQWWPTALTQHMAAIFAVPGEA